MLSLQTVHKPSCLRRYWKLNNSLLEDNIFTKNIETLATNIFKSEKSDYASQWELFKFKSRELAIRRSIELKKDRDCMETELLNKTDTFWKVQTLSQTQQSELQSSKLKLDDLYISKATGAFVHSKARWIEKGERNIAYFLPLKK